MRIASIRITDVRSLADVEVEPDAHINLLVGPNGSGKTSFLEAIHLLSLGRSFRTRKTRAIIRHEADALTVFGRIDDEESRQQYAIGIEKSVSGARFRVDGEEVRSISSLARRLPVMVVAPEGLKALLEGKRASAPTSRLDAVSRGTELPGGLQGYGHVLRQRNAVLRAPGRVDLERELNVWDEQLAHRGEQLDSMRRRHVESSRMSAVTSEVIRNVLNEEVTWEYWGGWNRSNALQVELASRRNRDRQVGFTTVGPHRADIVWRGVARNGPREPVTWSGAVAGHGIRGGAGRSMSWGTKESGPCC